MRKRAISQDEKGELNRKIVDGSIGRNNNDNR